MTDANGKFSVADVKEMPSLGLLLKPKLNQGSYGPWKSWKVLEFYAGIFQDWKVVEN